MTSDADLVELTSTPTALEAEWIVGALKGLGIVAVTFGDALADEFSMSQKLLGLSGGVRVMVLRVQLERAREALARMETERPSPEELEAALVEVGEDADEGDADVDRAEPKGGGGRTAILVLLAAAVAVLGWLCISQHRTLSAWERASPVTERTWRGDGWESRWKDNGKLASITRDRNRNGVSEEAWAYDREGRLLTHSVDRNENEIWEVVYDVSPEGNEIGRSLDENENGIAERYEYAPVDGVQERWINADEDGRSERREFVDVESGEVLDAFEDRGREGFVRVE